MTDTTTPTSSATPIAQASYSGGQALPAVGSNSYVQAQQLAANNNTNPTIPTATITEPTKLNIPQTPNNGAAPASKIMGITQGLSAAQTALLNTTDAGEKNATDSYNSSAQGVQGLISQYLGKGQAQLNAESAANIPQFRTTANNLTTEYQTKQLAYNQQYNEIFNRPGGTMEQKAQEISSLNQLHSYDLASTGIQQAIAANQYQTAQSLVDHQIDVKYSPLKDAIDFGMQFLNMNKEILTQKEQQSFQANLAVQNQMYTEGQYYDHLQKDTQVDLIKQAAINGASPDVLSSMSEILNKGGSIGDVAAAGGQYLKSGNYTPIQTGVNSENGLPIYSVFNPKTGNIEPINPGNAHGVTGSTDTTVNGYQLGATTTLGAYASATSTQVNNVKSAVSKVQASVGTITDPTTAQAAINTLSPKSPITGDMVMSAATQYGVDPSVLIGVMQAETQLGTDGSKGAKQNNWGNVGNTDSLMASGQSVAMKAQEGVDAVAKNLAMRQVQQGQTDPAKPVDTTGYTPTQKANAIIQSIPQLIRPMSNSIPSTGDVYIDGSQLKTDAQAYMANNFAATHPGVRVLSADDVAQVKDLNKIASQVDTLAQTFGSLAPESLLGKSWAGITNTTGKILDTDTGSMVKSYEANVASGIGVINDILGSKRVTGFSGTLSSNSLPQLSKGFLFKTGDTYKDGMNKFNNVVKSLNSAYSSIFPNSQGVPLYSTDKGQTAPVTAPDGNQYVITQ